MFKLFKDSKASSKRKDLTAEEYDLLRELFYISLTGDLSSDRPEESAPFCDELFEEFMSEGPDITIRFTTKPSKHKIERKIRL